MLNQLGLELTLRNWSKQLSSAQPSDSARDSPSEVFRCDTYLQLKLRCPPTYTDMLTRLPDVIFTVYRTLECTRSPSLGLFHAVRVDHHRSHRLSRRDDPPQTVDECQHDDSSVHDLGRWCFRSNNSTFSYRRCQEFKEKRYILAADILDITSCNLLHSVAIFCNYYVMGSWAMYFFVFMLGFAWSTWLDLYRLGIRLTSWWPVF